MVEVGRKYYYKLAKTRGRPFVGEVVRRCGIFTEIENRGEIVRVPTKMIIKEYTFKPYNKRKVA